MARPCSICAHPERREIDFQLVSGTDYETLAERFGTSKATLSRHFNNHLGDDVAKAKAAIAPEVAEAVRQQSTEDLQHAIDVVKQLKAINGVCFHILKETRDAKQNGMALQAVDRIHKQIELQAKLLGQLQEATTVNVLVASPEWVQVRTALLDALRPYPDARMAVATVLESLA